MSPVFPTERRGLLFLILSLLFCPSIALCLVPFSSFLSSCVFACSCLFSFELQRYTLEFLSLFLFILFYVLSGSGLSCSLWDLRCSVQAPEHVALQLWPMGSVVASHRLICPAACGILVPQLGIKRTSAALEGKFLTTGTPEKSTLEFLECASPSNHMVW